MLNIRKILTWRLVPNTLCLDSNLFTFIFSKLPDLLASDGSIHFGGRLGLFAIHFRLRLYLGSAAELCWGLCSMSICCLRPGCTLCANGGLVHTLEWVLSGHATVVEIFLSVSDEGAALSLAGAHAIFV